MMKISIKRMVWIMKNRKVVEGEKDLQKQIGGVKMIKKNKEEVNDMEYVVREENGREGRFENEYWNDFAKGIYVDKV